MKKKHALSASRDPGNEFDYTPEEDEAWKQLESKIPLVQKPAWMIACASKEDLERLEREARKPKKKLYPMIPLLEGDQND